MLVTSQEGSVATVTINRPEVLNMLTHEPILRLRITSDRARFGMPEVRVGIPAVIEAAILPCLIGLGRAAEMVYLGEMIDAQEAWRIGLVNKVVPHEHLGEATRQLAEKSDSSAVRQPWSFRSKLMAQWMDLSLSDATEAGIQTFRETYKTGEPQKGMNAFLEKRKPNYADKL
jgi:enoyl-CoA hydratase